MVQDESKNVITKRSKSKGILPALSILHKVRKFLRFFVVVVVVYTYAFNT